MAAQGPLTREAFLVAYPVFDDAANAALVQAKLDLAHASYGWCADYPQYHGIVGNHAAHLLASEPGGHTMRLNEWDARTAYAANRDELLAQVPARGIVTR